MKKFLIFLLILPLFFFCSKKEEKVIARIDDEVITVDEFKKEIERLPLNMKILVAEEKGKRDYLDRLILKRLLLREAKKEGIEKTKEFQEKLKDIKDSLLIETLLGKKMRSDVKISDEEARAYYEKNKEAFKRGVEINTRHILLKTEEEAREIQKRLLAGEDFVELAKKYSVDPNAKITGGELGFHPKGTLLPEYEEAAFKLKRVGEVSGIVRTPLGFHIIRLEGIRPSSVVPFEEMKDFIKQRLIEEKQGEIIEKYVEDLKKKAKIIVYEEYLKEKKGETKLPENK